MDAITFEWDEAKNEINKVKHKVSFEEAQTVFYDEEALLIDDPEHSREEDRFIILGISKKANLLVVCHCYRASETVIRIISARKATKIEENQYINGGELA
ncbi:MAG: BrnT family toxin [Clostridia bacterium]|nr:BrnT family toxin [Clostridia bacterium]